MNKTTDTLMFCTAKNTLMLNGSDVTPGTVEIVDYGINLVISGHVSAILNLNLPFKDENYTTQLIDVHSCCITKEKTADVAHTKVKYLGNGYVSVTLVDDIPRQLISDILHEAGWKLMGYSTTRKPVESVGDTGCIFSEKWGQKQRSRKKSDDSPRAKPDQDTPRGRSSRRQSSVSRCGEEDGTGMGPRRVSGVSLCDDIAEFLDRRDRRRERRNSTQQ